MKKFLKVIICLSVIVSMSFASNALAENSYIHEHSIDCLDEHEHINEYIIDGHTIYSEEDLSSYITEETKLVLFDSIKSKAADSAHVQGEYRGVAKTDQHNYSSYGSSYHVQVNYSIYACKVPGCSDLLVINPVVKQVVPAGNCPMCKYGSFL